MNEIFQNLINARKIASSINNIIVGAEKEERYNKVVKKVVRRLVENYLYVKLEKYKWKIREKFLGFLELVIRLEKIKIEEEKVKEILD